MYVVGLQGETFMHNPTYLIRSRHNIYYFRCPLPDILHEQGRTKYFKISLRTRDPKEALHLANCFAYHIENILMRYSVANMDHAEIILILKDYFYELLDEKRAEIRRDGPCYDEVENLKKLSKQAEKAISEARNNILPDEDISERLQPIIDRFGLDLSPDDYETLSSRYKYALRGYCDKLIAHNENEIAFTFSTRPDLLALRRAQSREAKPENALGHVIDEYIADMKKSNVWEARTEDERRSCLMLLVEILGDKHNMPDIGKEQARRVKEVLRDLPTNRQTREETRNLPLERQLEVPDVPKVSANTANKYLMINPSCAVNSVIPQKDAASRPMVGLAVNTIARA